MVKISEIDADYMTLWANRKFHRSRPFSPDWGPTARPAPFGTYSWVRDIDLVFTGPFISRRKLWATAKRYERGLP